jgi:hypothetical protein
MGHIKDLTDSDLAGLLLDKDVMSQHHYTGCSALNHELQSTF